MFETLKNCHPEALFGRRTSRDNEDLIAYCAAFSPCARISRRMREPLYSVYMVASRSAVVYTGITSDLEHRVSQHKNGTLEGFTKKYKCSRLVYFERYGQVRSAIGREKQ